MRNTIQPQNAQFNPEITVTLDVQAFQSLIRLLEREEQEYGLSKPQLSALRTLERTAKEVMKRVA
jgi:thymidylate kinase